MKKGIIALIALMVCVTFTSQAQIFFKVEKPGSDKVSYLLGTHHFAPIATLDSLPGFEQAVQSVDRVYGEIDMALMQDPAAMMQMQQYMMAPADSTLDKLLTTQQLDSLATTWNTLTGGAAPLEMMYGLKPAVLGTQLAAIMSMQFFPDIDPTSIGLDAKVQEMGHTLGKQVGGLETVEYQMQMLFGIPLCEQADDLMDMVRDGGENAYNEAKDITEAYIQRDLDKVEQIMTDPEHMDSAQAERMLYTRNRNWAAELEQILPEHSVMVVVGAGHLPTDKGLIALLKALGYVVTPIA